MSTGLIISKTKTIQSFLATSSNNTHLSQDLRDIAASSSLSDDGSISYKSLRSIWLASDPLTRPDLSVLLSGSGFVFTSPKPREKVVTFVALLDIVSAYSLFGFGPYV
ncbi:hypothetical protein Tco_0041389 [Tanacetum coccineum]